MIIMSFKYGQLGNRLFLYTNFIANALEYNYKIINYSFDEYSKYFKLSFNNKKYNKKIITKKYRLINRIAIKLTNFLAKKNILKKFLIDDVEDFNMRNNNFLEDAKNKTLVPYGWSYRDGKSVKKYFEEIKKYFEPKDEYLINVNIFFKNIREEDKIVVGVHIRRGDYKDFENGNYFFDDMTYIDKMKQIKSIFSKNIVFLICSDETINLDIYEKNDLIVKKPFNTLIEDLYSLSYCDYIIGVPSTFSLWAAFYGRKPLCVIKKKDDIIRKNDFNIPD